jgi:tripeptide aminopeptidase
MDVLERFLRYVQVPTASDETTGTHPSTDCQLVLIRQLADEMKELGLTGIEIDEGGNVVGTLPGNCDRAVPAIALVAHVDTSPDAPGVGVKPRVVHYEGGAIELSPGISLSPRQFPCLKECEGLDLVVTDGTTLLGADDKAGVAEIMTAAERLIASDRPHGDVRLVFTTDEETGDGVDGLDVKKLACQYGYTVDGGPLGELEYENFNAASAVVTVRGVGIHPGSAKDRMVNASTVAMKLHAMLPAEQVPERTEGYEGFLHLHEMRGDVTHAELHYLIRDHDRAKFEQKKHDLTSACAILNAQLGEGTATVTITDSYYNMREQLAPHMHLIERAKAAFERNGVKPHTQPIRGGTDGARLSYMGLPCPNLSTGGYNYHGVYEFIPVQSLRTMPDVLCDLIYSFAE